MYAVLQAGIPGGSELVTIAFVVLSYAVVIAAAVKVARWLIRRETKELRQRVALLEHEVAALEEGADETARDGGDAGPDFGGD